MIEKYINVTGRLIQIIIEDLKKKKKNEIIFEEILSKPTSYDWLQNLVTNYIWGF